MRKNTFIELIRESRFREMFITEMGWNNYHGQAEIPLIDIDNRQYQFTTVAERNGFQILTCDVDEIPTASICKCVDTKLRRFANDYIAIYIKRNTEHHLWVAPVRNVDKRDLVTIEYETAGKADFLFSKIDGLSFDNTEHTTIVDVKERIQGTFAINSEKITKDFYSGFKKEHDAFAKFITGIDDVVDLKSNRNKQWYTSVMLNRLMFCYFIQKKGFLDGNVDYLNDKLKWCQKEKGENKFFKSFYQGFLMQLFQDGLNSPTHNRDFEQVYGRIPYLNGGMFDRHQIEQDYSNIDIADEAFEHLFEFFDKWRWHLDTRISATGKDINPDVLGYIFEQYINDRAQMGAYYTKEDITEYIGRNCIIPFLFDRLNETSPEAFKQDGYVWQTLTNSGDRYIYDAVKKSYTSDWRERIPENIAEGLDTTQPGLLERRKDWNTKTNDKFALPTEIWRETVERLQRCEDILNKIRNGKITHINDFITYNLDIRSFAYDLLQNTEDHLFILHFYKALQQITILDPTCGSGAFLFAAMNILEPLYEICIERMREFNEQNPNWFKPELDEIAHKYRSNIQYFIFKSIILRNLYGVDIMVEATEIAKLRLFLKMMAVVEVDFRADNMGLDPLPDIDFNIRCGNTLVGYATEEELNNDLTWGDMFANQEFKEKVESEMKLVAAAYDIFKSVQFTQSEDMAAFKNAKHGLNKRLKALNDLLNKRMHATTNLPYEEWLTTHQPFHWLAEFYQIIHDNGGFDVIIGNPPYVEYKSIKKYSISKTYKTLSCNNLFAFCSERSFILKNKFGKFGFIVPISVSCSKRMHPLQNILLNNGLYISNWSWRPSKLFDGNKSANLSLSIIICCNGIQNYGALYRRWYSENRSIIFNTIQYTLLPKTLKNNIIPKIGSITEYNLYNKILNFDCVSKIISLNETKHKMFYKRTGGLYWKIFTDFQPILYLNGIKTNSSKEEHICFNSDTELYVIICLFWSDFYWWWYQINSDVRNNNPSDLISTPYINSILSDKEFINLSHDLMKDIVNNAVWAERKYQGNISKYKSFIPKYSKPIIDKIDKVLARHYGFTDEELDFIINYDIKYRMGDELNDE